jgi:hypothetical protein
LCLKKRDFIDFVDVLITMSLFPQTIGHEKKGCILDVCPMTDKERKYLIANELLTRNTRSRYFFDEKGNPVQQKTATITVSFMETKYHDLKLWHTTDQMFPIVIDENGEKTPIFFSVMTRKSRKASLGSDERAQRLCMFEADGPALNVWSNELETIFCNEKSLPQTIARRHMMKNLFKFLTADTMQIHKLSDKIIKTFNDVTNTYHPEVGNLIKEFVCGV